VPARGRGRHSPGLPHVRRVWRRSAGPSRPPGGVILSNSPVRAAGSGLRSLATGLIPDHRRDVNRLRPPRPYPRISPAGRGASLDPTYRRPFGGMRPPPQLPFSGHADALVRDFPVKAEEEVLPESSPAARGGGGSVGRGTPGDCEFHPRGRRQHRSAAASDDAAAGPRRAGELLVWRGTFATSSAIWAYSIRPATASVIIAGSPPPPPGSPRGRPRDDPPLAWVY